MYTKEFVDGITMRATMSVSEFVYVGRYITLCVQA